VPADDLAWLAVIGGAIALAAALIWLAPPLSHHYPAPIHDVFGVWRGLIAPEPLEDVRSMLTLATPILLAGVVLAFGSRQPSRRSLDYLVVAVQVIGIGVLVWGVLGQIRTGPLVTPDYFDQYLLSLPNLIAGAVIGLALTAAIVRPPALARPESILRVSQRLRGSLWVPLAIALLASAIWLLPAVNTDSTLSQAGRLAAGHIPVQGEDYFAVVNGRTPLVNYISQYANLLPLIVAPVLRAFGPSITAYSITMCVLSGVGMMAIYGAFSQVTRSAWTGLVLYVPWVALSLFPWNDIGPYREFNGIYHGILPDRYFGPFVLALLCALFIRGRRIPIFALFAFAGLVLLNNYEFGVGALLATVVALPVSWDRSLPLRRRLPPLLAQGGTGLLAALALVSAVMLIRTGQLPDPALLTYFNRLFLQDSYGLEPMPAVGLHWALYATYAATLLIAAVRYLHDKPDRTLTGMLAFSGIFGLTTGMYFVGRSSQYQLMLLFPAWGLALALVAWTAAGSLRSARASGTGMRRLLLPGCAALIGFGVMLSAIDRIPLPNRQIDRLEAGGPIHDTRPSERFIESRTRPGEHVLMIGTGTDHLLAEKIGVVNVSPLNGVSSLISPAEADRSLNQLQDEGGNLVFEAVSGRPVGGFSFGVPELATILRERGYRLVDEDPSLYLRVWRRAAS
jgi:hypothetical protein